MHLYPNGNAMVTVNGRDLSEFSAKLNSDYEISGPEISADTWQGRNRSTLLLLGQTYGLLRIRLPIDFWGSSKVDTMEKIADFNGTTKGLIELDLHDGFVYKCVLTEIGAPEWVNDELCTTDYELIGTRHKGPVVLSGKTPLAIANPSTVDRTDCRITIEASFPAANEVVSIWLTTGSLIKTFLSFVINVTGGEYEQNGALVIDGFNKTITYNGNALPTEIEWQDYPYLAPGSNTIFVLGKGGAGSDLDISVEYIPTYI